MEVGISGDVSPLSFEFLFRGFGGVAQVGLVPMDKLIGFVGLDVGHAYQWPIIPSLQLKTFPELGVFGLMLPTF